MEGLDTLYTVEDIAKMTGFTSRTIRNYLKNGTLQGQKIGGQWRFTMENIKRLFDSGNFSGDFSRKNKQQVLNFINGVNPVIQGKTRVCAVIDRYCENQKQGHQVYEKLVEVINSREDGAPPVKCDFEFMGKENKARFY